MAGYILEFRGEDEKNDVLEKMHKAKKAVCEAWEALEESSDYSERRNGGMYYRGGNIGYRNYDSRYNRRDEWDDDYDMRERRGRRY